MNTYTKLQAMKMIKARNCRYANAPIQISEIITAIHALKLEKLGLKSVCRYKRFLGVIDGPTKFILLNFNREALTTKYIQTAPKTETSIKNPV